MSSITIQNTYNVPAKQWAKWSPSQASLFNLLYEKMKEAQEVYRHPKAPILHEDHWNTVCWNTAWTAADLLAGVDAVALRR